MAQLPSETSHMADKKSPIWGMTNHPRSSYTYSIGGAGPELPGASARGSWVRQRLSMVEQAVRNACIGGTQPNSLGEEP